MWKRAFFLVLLAVLGAIPGQAQTEKQPPVTKEAVRDAIAAFQKDPTGTQAKEARARIVRFARESPEVEVHFAPKVTPWVNNAEMGGEDGLSLMAAYIAGNVQAQLDKGKAQDEGLAGVVQVIATYRQLQKANPSLKIADVDRFIELQSEGRLAEYLKESSTGAGAP